jgi:hypothetical protein
MKVSREISSGFRMTQKERATDQRQICRQIVGPLNRAELPRAESYAVARLLLYHQRSQ